MRTSEDINEIAGALAKAQGDFPAIEKGKTAKVRGQSRDGRGYEYSYSYADIADVLSAILPVLSRHGLAVIQPTVIEGGAIHVRTRIIHTSGQWLESDYPVCTINGDHQKMGGALTYSRRYALCSLLGIAAEEDTDGQGAADLPDNRAAPKKAPAPKPQPAPAQPVQASEQGNAGDPFHAGILEDCKAWLRQGTTPPALKQKAKDEKYLDAVKELPSALQKELRDFYAERMDELRALELAA